MIKYCLRMHEEMCCFNNELFTKFKAMLKSLTFSRLVSRVESQIILLSASFRNVNRRPLMTETVDIKMSERGSQTQPKRIGLLVCE